MPETTSVEPDVARNAPSRDKHHPYDEAVVPRVAELLGASVQRRPLAVKGSAVYELRLLNQTLGQEVLVTLWPGLRRVDARVGDVFVMARGIGRVTLEPGVEAVFWKEPGPGYLLVTPTGKVSASG